jgi:putative endonuclease
MSKPGYVYILTNKNHSVFYTGVTSDLETRLIRHRNGHFGNSFTARYNVGTLVFFERLESIEDAIACEKQIKAGSRQKKIELILRLNPEWKDLSGISFCCFGSI